MRWSEVQSLSGVLLPPGTTVWRGWRVWWLGVLLHVLFQSRGRCCARVFSRSAMAFCQSLSVGPGPCGLVALVGGLSFRHRVEVHRAVTDEAENHHHGQHGRGDDEHRHADHPLSGRDGLVASCLTNWSVVQRRSTIAAAAAVRRASLLTRLPVHQSRCTPRRPDNR